MYSKLRYFCPIDLVHNLYIHSVISVTYSLIILYLLVTVKVNPGFVDRFSRLPPGGLAYIAVIVN